MARLFVKMHSCLRGTPSIYSRNKFCSYKNPEKLPSALFIPGNKAMDTFSYFSPYLDFDSRFENLVKTQEDLKRRGLNLDLSELKTTWDMYKTLLSKKEALEENQKQTNQQISNLYKKEDRSKEEEEELNGLKTKIQIIKRDNKILLEAIWGMEEDIVIRCLKLPNVLNDRTSDTDKMLESFGQISSNSSKENHIKIGTDLGLLEYKNRLHYFLFDEAALFEQSVLNFAARILENEKYVRVAGLDFARASIIEGCGMDHNDLNSAFLLKSINDEKNSLNPLHLVGSSSLLSFLALNTKMKFNPKDLPVCYFSTGRQYSPECNGNLEGLFGVCQETVVQVFGLAKNDTQCDKLLNDFLRCAKTLYGELCDHYRFVRKSAANLKPSESLRVSLETWSYNYEQYVEVGYISLHSDYLSKRLLIVYQTAEGRDFPSIISGTLISVPKMLGCLLEKDVTKAELRNKIESVFSSHISNNVYDKESLLS